MAAKRLGIRFFLMLIFSVVSWSFAAEQPAKPDPQQDQRSWTPLRMDRLHDPDGPSIHELQEPSEALKLMPHDAVGNQVRWVQALQSGIINPRTNLFQGTQINVLDLDIIFNNTGDNYYVRFPHKQHTEWLDCSNCHDKIFKKKYGSTKFKMMDILQGEYCGRCHGAVAFPLTECYRCHSINPKTYTGTFGPQKALAK